MKRLARTKRAYSQEFEVRGETDVAARRDQAGRLRRPFGLDAVSRSRHA